MVPVTKEQNDYYYEYYYGYRAQLCFSHEVCRHTQTHSLVNIWINWGPAVL